MTALSVGADSRVHPRVRLGAVGYLNARPLVYGLDALPQFDVRYDVPSECARLLHAHDIDVGLIPSIEYLRGPGPYVLVPGPAVVSKGPVASVALFTAREPRDIRTVAMDSSSRTSVGRRSCRGSWRRAARCICYIGGARRRYSSSPSDTAWRV